MVMNELPEEEIEEAATDPGTDDHAHDDVRSEDGTLAEHLHTTHELEVDPSVSAGTQEGLHDRLHGATKAADA